MRYFALFFLALCCFALWAAEPDAASILRAIDKNMTAKSSKSVTRMVISGKRSSRTVESINYSRGTDKFFCEYTAPPRDNGTKMLKLAGNLWIYNPATDRSIQISGNMLKQSVMGSDLSYEDFMEETKLAEAYSASVDGDISYTGRDCCILTLTAAQKGLAYHKRRLYVDKERYVVLYEQLYAKSGKLLKSISSSHITQSGTRWYPRQIMFKDELKEGKGTAYYVDSIQFDIEIPAATFSKAKLKK